jgi:protein-S-isoprenylcysteine O-methyltransferase Ste14
MFENLLVNMRIKTIPLRLMVLVLLIMPVIFFNDFYIHVTSHFSGTIISSVITQQWHIVLINILIFISFLLPLSFRRKINWKEYGLVTAFFVSLFIEMYGIPLTVFFASKTINNGGGTIARTIIDFEIFGVNIAMDLAMVYATVLMIIGTFLIVLGWITLYKNIEENSLVISGVYNISRHPQYLGFLMIIIGWLIGWPTILTVIFSIILIYKYIKVSLVEENEIKDLKGYDDYRNKVPFLL